MTDEIKQTDYSAKQTFIPSKNIQVYSSLFVSIYTGVAVVPLKSPKELL